MMDFSSQKCRKSGLLNSVWSKIDILGLYTNLTNGGICFGPQIRHFRGFTVNVIF